jgi:hypothetical protein
LIALDATFRAGFHHSGSVRARPFLIGRRGPHELLSRRPLSARGLSGAPARRVCAAPAPF